MYLEMFSSCTDAMFKLFTKLCTVIIGSLSKKTSILYMTFNVSFQDKPVPQSRACSWQSPFSDGGIGEVWGLGWTTVIFFFAYISGTFLLNKNSGLNFWKFLLANRTFSGISLKFLEKKDLTRVYSIFENFSVVITFKFDIFST